MIATGETSSARIHARIVLGQPLVGRDARPEYATGVITAAPARSCSRNSSTSTRPSPPSSVTKQKKQNTSSMNDTD